MHVKKLLNIYPPFDQNYKIFKGNFKYKKDMSVMPSYQYAILVETNGAEYESWYTFIRYEGNEEALEHLNHQLNKITFCILDDLSTFDLEFKRLVSEQTAREMCKMDLNSYMFHRKFDGKLSKIDFDFSRRDNNDDRIEKVNNKLGYGGIDQFIEDEDPCDSDFENPSDLSDDQSSSSSDEEDDRNYKRNDRKKDVERHKKDVERSKKEEDERVERPKKEEDERVERPKKEERVERPKKDEEDRVDRPKKEERSDRDKNVNDKKEERRRR